MAARSNISSSSSSSSNNKATPSWPGGATHAGEAVLRAVARQGQDESSMLQSFWCGGACLAGAAAVGLAWHARPSESPWAQQWLAGKVEQALADAVDYQQVNTIVGFLLGTLEQGLRLAAFALLLGGLGCLALAAHAMVKGVEAQPELEGLTDEQRRLLGLDSLLPLNRSSAAAASAAAAGGGGGGGFRPPPASPYLLPSPPASSSFATLLSPPSSSLLRDRTSPFASSGGRPPLSNSSGGRRAYGRSRGIVGAALSFGGGAEEQVAGFLEVGGLVGLVWSGGGGVGCGIGWAWMDGWMDG
jgi:hypothetical protein